MQPLCLCPSLRLKYGDHKIVQSVIKAYFTITIVRVSLVSVAGPCLVPRRLSLGHGRAREEGKAKGRETPGRFCFQDGGDNGGRLRNF